jgi:MFS family permease
VVSPSRVGATRATPDVESVQGRTVRTLASSQVLSGIAVAGSIPAGALIAAGVSGSEAIAGLAQTFGVVGAAIFALPLARLALSRGRRAALSVGYALGVLGAVTVVVGAVSRSIAVVLVGCLLVGVASASGYQARYAATDLATPERRARSLAIVVWAATIGAVLGPNLLNASGIVALDLGLPQLSGPYVVAAVCLGGAAIVLVLFLRPDPYLVSLRVREGGDAPHPKLRTGLEHIRRHPMAILGITTIAIGHVAMVMVMVMTPVHMAHVDVTLQVIGLVISVHVAGMYAFSPVVGWAVDRFGRIPIIGAGIVILVLACLVSGLAAADNALVLGVGLFLLGLGWSCTLIAGSTLITDSAGPEERPSVQGLSDLVMNTAGAVGGAVAGVIVYFGSYGLLCAAAALPVLGLAALTVALRTTSQSAP